MRTVKGLLMLGLTVGALAVVPSARADHWEQKDGYWYLYSDKDQKWYYQSGDNWLVFENGAWVPWGVTASSPGISTYNSYYYNPTGYSTGYSNYGYSPNYHYNSGYRGGYYGGGYGGYGIPLGNSGFYWGGGRGGNWG
ncbi:MAG: hypothetical protein K2R98_08340, partial [Gemmataceae bacterium]|nr:hypothetical protein [Gemmataceae bacterium]